MTLTGKNTCAMSEDCEGKEADHGLMCADHRAEDEEMRAAMDRAYYRGTPMDHMADAMAFMVAGVRMGKTLAQEMAMREVALQGRSLVRYFRDENYGLHIEHISMDEFIHWSADMDAEYVNELKAAPLRDVEWRKVYQQVPIVRPETFDEAPTVPLQKVWRDHGHPRSPKASRRKGR